MSEQIKKVLSNVVQSLSSTEQATARSNIGAQAQLTAGTNIYIDPDNVISVSGMTPDKVYVFNDNSFNRNAVKQAFDNGKLVYVNTKFAPDYSKVVRLRLAGYDDTTINGEPYEVYWFCSPVTRYSADARKYGNAEFNLQAHFYYYNKTTGVVTSSGGTSWQLRQPDWSVTDETADNCILNKPSLSETQTIAYGASTATHVSTLLVDCDDPEGYVGIKTDGSTQGLLVQGPYKTLLDSGINGGSGVGSASTPIYVDTDGTFKAGTPVANGGKHSHTAELYFHHSDDGDVYHIRNVANYCMNHVVVANHSSDICSIVVEAPTLGTNEEYDYYIVFDCADSSGGCNVNVQNCDAEIFNFPYYEPNGPQGQPYVAFQDITYTWVEFTGSPRYHVEVIGNRYTVHRF